MADSKGPEPEFVDWLKTACRYLVLANAGGAVLMVSFVGATAGRLEMPWWTSAALALFLVGIILGALVVLGQLSGRWQTLMQKDVPGLPKTFGSWVVRLAGERQVPGAEVALVTGVGGAPFGAFGSLILTKD